MRALGYRRRANFGNTTAALSNSTFSFGDRAQDSINGVSGVGEFHLYPDDGERLEGGEIGTQIDGVFLSGHETSSLAAALKVQQLADVFLGIGVMIAIESFGYRLDGGGAA